MIEAEVEIPGIGAQAYFYRPDGVADFPGVQPKVQEKETRWLG